MNPCLSLLMFSFALLLAPSAWASSDMADPKVNCEAFSKGPKPSSESVALAAQAIETQKQEIEQAQAKLDPLASMLKSQKDTRKAAGLVMLLSVSLHTAGAIKEVKKSNTFNKKAAVIHAIALAAGTHGVEELTEDQIKKLSQVIYPLQSDLASAKESLVEKEAYFKKLLHAYSSCPGKAVSSRKAKHLGPGESATASDRGAVSAGAAAGQAK